MKPQQVIVESPRFKITAEFELNSVLKSMGMAAAFDGSQADFAGMTGKRDLVISNVVHKAYVDVNEQGTEAAAATATLMRATAIRLEPNDPPVFRADHPFVFFSATTAAERSSSWAAASIRRPIRAANEFAPTAGGTGSLLPVLFSPGSSKHWRPSRQCHPNFQPRAPTGNWRRDDQDLCGMVMMGHALSARSTARPPTGSRRVICIARRFICRMDLTGSRQDFVRLLNTTGGDRHALRS